MWCRATLRATLESGNAGVDAGQLELTQGNTGVDAGQRINAGSQRWESTNVGRLNLAPPPLTDCIAVEVASVEASGLLSSKFPHKISEKGDLQGSIGEWFRQRRKIHPSSPL